MASLESSSFENKVALVVDPSPAIAQITSQLLRNELKFGKVVIAQSGRQGLQTFRSETVDWVFSDYEMPEMNGLEFLAALRESDSGKALPFILMTTVTDKETLTKAVEAGATDLLAKPFSPATLIHKVRRIAHGGGERRVAERTPVPQPNQGRIAFSPTAAYKSEIVNISATGCLLRTTPFGQGGAIYDSAQLNLAHNGYNLAVKGVLVRLELDRSHIASKSVLAAFQFLDLDAAAQKTIQTLQTLQEQHIDAQA
jgi:two-component system chemotaxis response regulator CheY